VSLRIKLEGAWERLEELARELPGLSSRDVLSEREAVAALLENHRRLPPVRSLLGKSRELDALVQKVDASMTRAVSELGFASVAELRAALHDEVLADVPSTGWRSLLQPGRFVLTRRRLWWRGEKTRSWPSDAMDPKELPELARVSVAHLQLLQALAALHATPLFRDVPLEEPDRSRILEEATRLACAGDVVLMDDAVLFIPQVSEAWSFATGQAGPWSASVPITVLVQELLKLPQVERDAALWRAAQHRDALVVRASEVAERHFVEAGAAWFGGIDDGVLVRMTPDEPDVLLAWLKGLGIEQPRTRAEYLRDVQRTVAGREDRKADAATRAAALERDGGQARMRAGDAEREVERRRYRHARELERTTRQKELAEKEARRRPRVPEPLRPTPEEELAEIELQLRALQRRRDELMQRRE
jgi:hypothetical protein